MQTVIQPFVNLYAANTAVFTHFVQSRGTPELLTASPQNYMTLAQKAFGQAPAFGANVDLFRKLSENYATFASEYSAALLDLATKAQGRFATQGRAATDWALRSTESITGTLSSGVNGAGHARTK